MARRNPGLAIASKTPQLSTSAQPSVPAETAVRGMPAGRAGKAMVAGWFDKAAAKQLRFIAVNRETTIQQQLGRALNLLFRDEGLPALAQIEREDTA
jgi:hypothetical protein